MDKEVKALKLEVQELRQCIISLLMHLRLNPLSEVTCDHWWDKLTSYPRTEGND